MLSTAILLPALPKRGANNSKRTYFLLNVTNQLPSTTLIPIDGTLPTLVKQVRQLPANRIATHLHGGFTPWFSDGTPFQWFDPTRLRGESFMNVPGTNLPAGTATYWYPMDQSARSVWYHDHAVGVTRTNAYAGIASALVLTDTFESGLISSGLLPDFVGIPLIIQDKTFVPQNIHSVIPLGNGVTQATFGTRMCMSQTR